MSKILTFSKWEFQVKDVIKNKVHALFSIYLVPLFQNDSLHKTLSYENDFDLHENEPLDGTQFHMNGFARRLVLTEKQNVAWRSSVEIFV